MALLLQAIAETHNEEFVIAAEGCGLLLNGGKWILSLQWPCGRKPTFNLWQEQIILRHLSNHFGQKLTVLEQNLRELKEGTLLPVTVCLRCY